MRNRFIFVINLGVNLLHLILQFLEYFCIAIFLMKLVREKWVSHHMLWKFDSCPVRREQILLLLFYHFWSGYMDLSRRFRLNIDSVEPYKLGQWLWFLGVSNVGSDPSLLFLPFYLTFSLWLTCFMEFVTVVSLMASFVGHF